MKYTLKTRLIGAALLAAIALIFLPSFFKDKDVAPVSTKTQIPPKPSIAAEEFKAPQPVAGVEPAPAPETMFMTDQQASADQLVAESSAQEKEIVDNTAGAKATIATATSSQGQKGGAQSTASVAKVAQENLSSHAKSSKPNSNTTATTPVARLNEKGVPDAWMIQVGSFSTKEAADKIRDQLQAKGLKAFDRKVTNINGVAAKVFVGPVLDKTQAATLKKQVDHELKVNSMIVKFQP